MHRYEPTRTAEAGVSAREGANTDERANSETIADVPAYDVVVVGGGNAGFCAAHAARERGASVLVLEKTPKAQAGGNSFYTAGAFRFAHDGPTSLRGLLEEPESLENTVVPAYSEEDFTADMRRLTGQRCDPELTRQLVSRSEETVHWLSRQGIRWRLMPERQAYRSGDEWVFFGGLSVGAVHGGKGLITQHTEAADRAGVSIAYNAAVTDFLRNSAKDRITGVRYRDDHGFEHVVRSRAVVLAAGGFEADPQRRARYLGQRWHRALVRGNPSNTGEILDLALQAGAAAYGDWTSCHSVAWDAGAPASGGDRELTNQRTRQSYPIGIVVNVDGQRFLDEGADFRNYTYAKYGREILHQPDGIAFQLFDATTRPLLRTEEYDSRPITGARADTLEQLAAELDIDPAGLVRTVDEFNASIEPASFDPAVKDGRRARTEPPKSNWSVALETPPYYGYAVACGITFTFGGVKIDECARVLDDDNAPVEGLYAAGELVGGLFSGNYPGGTGLTAGAVFGRAAGADAAARYLSR